MVLHGHASRLWDVHVDSGLIATASEDRTVRCGPRLPNSRTFTLTRRRCPQHTADGWLAPVYPVKLLSWVPCSHVLHCSCGQLGQNCV